MKVKFLPVCALVLLGTAPGRAQSEGPRITGVVVNGTQDGTPLPGAEVLLRAGEEGTLRPVAQTVADAEGRFVFDKVAAAPGQIFLPGASHQGIHYPGPRIQPPPGAMSAPIKLVVFDTVTSPNPLVVDVHEIDVRTEDAIVEVTETVCVNNPSLTTYVGQAGDGNYPVTLSLSIPDGFERVTFYKEFHGRRFKLINKRLVTDIPFTPGKREVRFTYRLPMEENNLHLEWGADVPCTRVLLSVSGKHVEHLESNLRRVARPDAETVVLESAEATLPAGHMVKLHLGSLSRPWIVHLRWLTLAVLAGLILATAAQRMVRRTFFRASAQATASASPGACQPRSQADKRAA